MTTIQILITLWLALGLFTVAAIEIAARRSRTDGPLSQDSIAASIGLTLALAIIAPAMAIYVLALSPKILWEGRLPGVDIDWWPTRVRRAYRRDCIASEGELSRPEILCDMIDVRKSNDERLRGEEPWKWWWQRSVLAASPEAVILDDISNFHWLLDGGFSEKEAARHLQSLDGPVDQSAEVTTLRTLIERKLSIADPAYLDLDPDVLTKSLSLASTWARARIDRSKSSPPYPPSEWLGSVIQHGDALPPLFKDMPPPVVQDTQWRHLKAHMTDSDELRLFCSSGESWSKLTGRSGVALVRNGRAIAHVVTIMN